MGGFPLESCKAGFLTALCLFSFLSWLINKISRTLFFFLEKSNMTLLETEGELPASNNARAGRDG